VGWGLVWGVGVVGVGGCWCGGLWDAPAQGGLLASVHVYIIIIHIPPVSACTCYIYIRPYMYIHIYCMLSPVHTVWLQRDAPVQGGPTIAREYPLRRVHPRVAPFPTAV
jgi:hypothetical protein